MSESESASAEELPVVDELKEVYRSVTPNVEMHENLPMSLLGLIWFGLLVVILLPLAPFIALIWAIGWVRERFVTKEEVDIHVREQIRARERARRRRMGPS